MKGGLSEAYSYPSLAQPLLALPHSRSHRRRLKPGPPGFFGAHERRGRAHSGGVATRANDITGAPDDGGFVARPGLFPAPCFTRYRIRPSALDTVTNNTTQGWPVFLRAGTCKARPHAQGSDAPNGPSSS